MTRMQWGWIVLSVQAVLVMSPMPADAERKDSYADKIEREKKTLEKLRGTIVGEPNYSAANTKKSIDHLEKFGLGSKESEILEDIQFDLPKLESPDLNEHFEIIARQQSQPYVELLQEFIQTDVPTQPTKWACTKGWTKYFP